MAMFSSPCATWMAAFVATALIASCRRAPEPDRPPTPPPRPQAATAPAVQTAQGPASLPPALARLLANARIDLKPCITAAGRKGEMLRGLLPLRLTIAASGAVVDAEATTPALRASQTGRCAAARALGWTFPSPGPDPLTVTYPFALDASEAP